MFAEIESKLATFDQIVLFCARRMGKSFMLLTYAFEYALKNPNAQIKYISSTRTGIVDFLIPMAEQILDDCPADVRPVWIKHDGAFRFWNGSRIIVRGTDAKGFRKLRGQAADLTIIDECGFMSDFNTTVVSVLKPQSLTTGGKWIMASTAPDTPGHDFVGEVTRAREEGSCVERTIYQRLANGSPHQTPEQEAAENAARTAKAIKDCHGADTPAFKREYLNDLGSLDSTRAAVPVFTTARIKGTPERPGIVRIVQKPKHCHKYSSADLGFIDQSAAVFGWLAPGNPRADEPTEFLQDVAPPGALVIEDELVAMKSISEDFAPLILDKEKLHWGGEPPQYRIVDGTPEQIERIQRAGISVFKTRTDKPDAGIDELQTLMVKGLLVIHPRCTRLIACIQAATWKKDGTRLERHAEHGHFDLLMALVYMVRNLRRYADPYPTGYNSGPKGPGQTGGASSAIKSLQRGFKKLVPW